ncbi:MAG: hypothetical protein LBB78_08205 [Spirochaetaceae bacterium]|jgi:hypothetical protein|nr:hypothetical protein [Spirochaetaceae bacterium]
MSKKNLFAGGAALFLIAFLALIGCNNASDPVSLKPLFSVKSVVLEANTLIVTFSDTITAIDDAFKSPGYTLDAANYTVSKNNTGVLSISTTITPVAGDTSSVKMAMSEIHLGLNLNETLNVNVKNIAGGLYTVKPLTVTIDKGSSDTNLVLVFSENLYDSSAPLAGGAGAASFFKLTAADSASTLGATVDSTNLNTITITLTGGIAGGDEIGPAASTVNTLAGMPWKESLAFDDSTKTWSITNP